MDDSREKRSLADDPAFLASLSDLDRHLGSGPSPEPAGSSAPLPPPSIQPPPIAATAAPPGAKAARRMPLPPSIVSPFDELTANDAPQSKSPWVEPSHQATVLRPLIDLFPPETPHEKRAAPSRGTGAPAPHAPRRPEPARRAPASLAAAAAGSGATCESYYGFNEKPFSLSSDPHFFFHSTPHDAVCQQLLTAVRKREGLVVLTGEIGTGKTLLCRTVIEQLDHRTLTSLVTDPFVTGEDLLKQILADFGVASQAELARGDATCHELSTTLLSFVESLTTLQASAIVIIDEAQNLPPDVMEQIRILAEAGEASSLLQVVLVGQPGLTDLLRRGEHTSLQQRVTVRATLLPLPADEVDGYIMHRLAVAGSAPRVHFDPSALERIYRLSMGLPRVINLICDRALARGFEAAASVIDAALVEAAAEDLDLGEPRSRARNAASNMLTVAVLAVCVLLGAGLAAWIFHDALARALALWRR